MEQNLNYIQWLLIFISFQLAFLIGQVLAHAGECSKPVQVISNGEIANCSGFLFSDEAEKVAATAKKDVDFFNILVPKLEERLKLEQERSDILEKRLNLYINQAEILAEDKVKSETRKFWERLGLFSLGIITMYGAYQVAR